MTETGNGWLVSPPDVSRRGASVHFGRSYTHPRNELRDAWPESGIGRGRRPLSHHGRATVRLLPRHTDSFQGNTVASRGVRLRVAPDAPPRGRCSSVAQFPVGRAVEPWGWPSAHTPTHWVIPVTIRIPTQCRGRRGLEEADRANLPVHLARSDSSAVATARGRAHMVARRWAPRERTASTSRASQNAAGPSGRSPTGFAGCSGRTPFPGRTLCERYHRTPRRLGRCGRCRSG